MVFVAWPRALSWEEQKIIDLFLRWQHQNILITSAIIFAWFSSTNIIFICHYFPWMSWPFLRAPTGQLLESTIEFRRAVSGLDVSVSLKHLCTLQIGNSFVFVFNHCRLSIFWKLLWMIKHWRYMYSRWCVCCTESVTLKHTRTCTCNVGKCHACTTHRRHTLRRCEYFLLASPNL